MKRTLSVLCIAGLIVTAADQATAPLGSYTAGERRYWAFQPRAEVTPPPLARTPIDAFLLEALQKQGLKPAPRATREQLIRRVTYDLTGLPPTLSEIDAYVTDKSAQAWEIVVDRLLASPHYGEQWGRHWLDVVRFAESDGYEYDMHRPDSYRYRDYVIQSFNADKPYDQFVKEQLAGDEIDPGNQTLLIASGFNRLGPLRKNAGNQDVASSRNEVLTETTNIIGAAFLGITVGCARCHDHKFDPIRQSDYYRLQAHFAQLQPHDIVQASAQEQDAYKATIAPLQEEMRKLQAQLKKAPEAEKAKLETLLEQLDEKLPPPLTSIYAVRDDPSKPTPINVLFHGEYSSPTARVGVRRPGILQDASTPEEPLDTPTPRLKLANWIADPANPLTARVMVNRVWQYHFGRGIVSTPNDLGRMGGRPSNPRLLDWLANQFVANGWKLKPLHRLILLSDAYQQSSITPLETAASEKDPDNALLWKFSPRRLEAEELRDSMLSVAGKLNTKIGGPSFLVPIDRDLVLMLKRPQYWTPTRDKSEYDRRSLYMIYKRNLRLPFLEVFDAPDTLSSCERREQATHAPQALELLNGKTSNELAAQFAERLKQQPDPIDQAFRLTLGRLPSRVERDLRNKFLASSGSLKEFALALFNLNSFLYVD